MGRPSKVFSRTFTFAALAIVCIASGLAGYNLSISHRWATGTPWSDSVIWWQVWFGIAALPFAAYFARVADKAARKRSHA